MTTLSQKQLMVLSAMRIIAEADGPIIAPKITAKLGLPTRYLEVTLQVLVAKRILKSKRGPIGGYVLCQGLDTLTITDILKAVSCRTERTNDIFGIDEVVAELLNQDSLEDVFRVVTERKAA